jgi:hypothetical protein
MLGKQNEKPKIRDRKNDKTVISTKNLVPKGRPLTKKHTENFIEKIKKGKEK